MRTYVITREGNGHKTYDTVSAASEFLAAQLAGQGDLTYIGGNGTQGFYRDELGVFSVSVE